MHLTRRPRATGALLALVVLLSLLGAGTAGRATTAAEGSGSLLAGPRIGMEQGLIGDRGGRSLAEPGGSRENRERPGPALVGALAVVVAAAFTVVAARRPDPPAGRDAAVTDARAPPPLRPAAS
jgi:hypothetical protein